MRRAFLSTALKAVLCTATFGSVLAKDDPYEPILLPLINLSENSWTLLTMSPDGSWGVARDLWQGMALARAVADCKAMSQAKIGCGYKFKSVQSGWLLANRCGNENILAGAKTLSMAEGAAERRETELREVFARDLPRCVRLLTVNPYGAISDGNGDVQKVRFRRAENGE